MAAKRRFPPVSVAAFTALTVAVVVLGLWGFTLYLDQQGTPGSLTRRAYLTAQLFTLESGAVTGAVPWQLEIARLAAPVVAAYALVRVAAEIFANQLDRWRLRKLRGHAIVVTLDDCGQRLCHKLSARGLPVVGVDPKVDDAVAAALRESGVRVVRQDPASAQVLRTCGIAWAQHLVVRGLDDGVTAAVVAQARELAADSPRNQPLTCVGVLSDPSLWQLLITEELQRDAADRCRVDFVDLDGAALLLLLRDHPPLRTPDGGLQPVLVTGTGGAATRLVQALGRVPAGGDGRGRLPVHVLGAHPVESAPGAALPSGRAPVRVYVCDDDAPEAVRRTVALRAQLPGGSGIVVVRHTVEPVTRLLTNEAGPDGCAVHTYGLTDALCAPDILLHGTSEMLARALHDHYVTHRRREGGTAPADPALAPWEQLPETLRESNRDQARHVASHLRAVGRLVGPLVDGTGAAEFRTEETELLARLEHDRWMAERRRNGWRPGPRDAKAKTTPYLVPWEDLPEEVRDIDRLFVRNLPEVLASFGLQAVPDPYRRAAP